MTVLFQVFKVINMMDIFIIQIFIKIRMYRVIFRVQITLPYIGIIELQALLDLLTFKSLRFHVFSMKGII